MSEVEKLAQVLYAKDKEPGSSGWLLWEEHSPRVHAIWHRYAERLLSSDWLREHDARMRAEGAAEVVERVEAAVAWEVHDRRCKWFTAERVCSCWKGRIRAALAGGSAQSPAPGEAEEREVDRCRHGEPESTCGACRMTTHKPGASVNGNNPRITPKDTSEPQSPGAPDEVEALAVAIRDGVHEHGNRVTHWQALDSARVVLAAGYLSPAQVVEAQAQAWDEGWKANNDWRFAKGLADAQNAPNPAFPANPYRADRLTREEGAQ